MSYAPLQPLTEEWSHVKKVGVIGAGVAGLQMARACKAHGLEVVVFDRAPDVGGLWRQNYSSYGLQVPKQFYEFPDFPFDSVLRGAYPTGAETQNYIKAYSDHYGLRYCLRLRTEVAHLSHRKDGLKGWTLKLVDVLSKAESEETFDFVIVATGMYSSPKNMPDFAGAHAFAGQLIHSSEYLAQSQAQGRRVLVIGCAKSAIDVVIDASKVAQEPPMLLFRQAHWCTPRWIAGIIPFQFVFLSRLGLSLVSWYKGAWPGGAPCWTACLSWLLWPLMWVAFRLVELVFALQRGQLFDYFPGSSCLCTAKNRKDVVADFYGYGHLLDRTFMTEYNAGRLKRRRGEIQSLGPGHEVHLSTGETMEVDLVICATGFRKTYDYLPADAKAKLDVQPDGLYLYRHCVPPAVRELNLAFCGSEASTISNILSSYLLAEYLARVMTGRLKIPSEDDMKAELETVKAWKRRWMPETKGRANMVMLHQLHYYDQLCRDMGENPSRKSCCLCEIFSPCEPQDYAGIMLDAKEGKPDSKV